MTKRLLLFSVLLLAAVPAFAGTDGLPGGTFPAQVTAVGGKDSNGKLQPISTNTSGQVVGVSAGAIAPIKSSAVEASHVIKASAGALVSFSVLDTAAEYILIIDAASLPANGAVTLLFPPIPVAANTLTMISFPTPLSASTGIVVCNSSTGTFTKTIGGSTCIFNAQLVQ